MSLSVKDKVLLRRFESQELPNAGFHHKDHVRVAWVYLNVHPFWKALERFRRNLRKFAAANGKLAIYHETVTCAFFVLINERIERSGRGEKWDEFAAANPDLLQWKESILSRYYKKRTLKSDLAKRVFLMPDRARKMGT